MLIKNIIVFMPRFLGDCINCTPAISLIKRHYPNTQIHLVLSRTNASLFVDDKETELIIDDRKIDRKKGALRLIKQLRSLNNSACVLMTNTFFDALITLLSGVSIRVGYNKEGRGGLLTHSLKFDRNRHYINRYAYLANSLCGNQYKQLPEVSIKHDKTKSSLKEAITFNIGLCILSDAKLSRHYPVKSAVSLIHLLQKNLNESIAVFMVGSSAESTTAEKVVSQCNKLYGLTNVRSLAGKTTVTELVNDIACFDMLISVDSGPLHVAAATKTPAVALHSKGTSPFSLVCPKSTVVEVVNSRGSYIHDNDQVLDLMPEDIVDSVKALMRKLSN